MINLQIYQLFLIFLASDHPSISRACGFGSKNDSDDVLIPPIIQHDIMKTINSKIDINTINYNQPIYGHVHKQIL